ncbi:MAG: hypothetical protein M3440_12420 [Chloroflexota bacterium]|nr:hypothetical protein [Chloroflexota bacterium]
MGIVEVGQGPFLQGRLVAAWFAVRFFLRLLTTTTLRPFGWYRIVAATLLLLAISADWVPG